MSKYFPAWFLGKNPLKHIISASYSGGLSEKFGRDVRDIIQSNRYKQVFTGIDIRDDQNSKKDINT